MSGFEWAFKSIIDFIFSYKFIVLNLISIGLTIFYTKKNKFSLERIINFYFKSLIRLFLLYVIIKLLYVYFY